MLTIDDARLAARQRWGRLSPLRIGYFVGLLDIVCENPYPVNSVAWRNFQNGVHHGTHDLLVEKEQ